ncbi:type III polyketide synthase [Aquimarina algicola]|uniref:Type III polyketide synthase n=1 Tax=Aquimarina algicola TaxID=2589995 RepID=A0A504JG89_9FLAO|nr:type III polyketide synthase [Aquimarina algicola]TPN87485.1 type III polyketide synthase [Aquimarina algicola]
MSLVTKPTVIFPEHEVSQDQMVNVLKELFPYHPKWDTVERMIRNTQVDHRNLLSPIDQVITHPGFEYRNKLYKDHGLKMASRVAKQVLDDNKMTPNDIDMLMVVSCTGFLMPSLTSYIISDLGFRPNTKQLPVAQLGCAAGAWALNRAYEYIKAYPDHNVLLLSVEFSSLLFQPEDSKISSLISNCLFGDAVSGCIIKGAYEDGDEGYLIEGIDSFVKKDSDHYIKYDVKSTGFHFGLDKEVMHSIKDVAPIMKGLIKDECEKEINDLDFHLFHTGGRKILDELVSNLDLVEENVSKSRQSLKNHGNIASGVVLDVLNKEFESKTRKNGDTGMMAAFGPGFTAEINHGTWIKN